MREDTKKKLTSRLRRIAGQVRGLEKMLASDKYCIDIITQSAAIRNALSAFEDHMLENHLSEHVVHQMKGKEEHRAIAEIIAVFKRAKRK